MKQSTAWSVPLCFLLLLALVLAGMPSAIAEDAPLSIPIWGEAGDRITAKNGHVSIPTGTVTHLSAYNPVDRVTFDDDPTQQITKLFELIAAADVVEDAPNDLSTFAETCDGTDLYMQYTPDEAGTMNVTLWSAYDKPLILIDIDARTGSDDDRYCITVESTELRQYMLELCQWRNYRREILKDTVSIGLSVREKNWEDGYKPIKTIKDSAWILSFISGIQEADVYGHSYNLPAQIRLEFTLENGGVEYAYMRTEPIDPLMQVGGQQIWLTCGEEKMIQKLLPEYK